MKSILLNQLFLDKLSQVIADDESSSYNLSDGIFLTTDKNLGQGPYYPFPLRHIVIKPREDFNISVKPNHAQLARDQFETRWKK